MCRQSLALASYTMAILTCIVSSALAYSGQPTRSSAPHRHIPPSHAQTGTTAPDWRCQFGGASGGEITVDPATGAFNVSFTAKSTFPTLVGAPPGVFRNGQWLTPGDGLAIAGTISSSSIFFIFSFNINILMICKAFNFCESESSWRYIKLISRNWCTCGMNTDYVCSNRLSLSCRDTSPAAAIGTVK